MSTRGVCECRFVRSLVSCYEIRRIAIGIGQRVVGGRKSELALLGEMTVDKDIFVLDFAFQNLSKIYLLDVICLKITNYVLKTGKKLMSGMKVNLKIPEWHSQVTTGLYNLSLFKEKKNPNCLDS